MLIISRVVFVSSGLKDRASLFLSHHLYLIWLFFEIQFFLSLVIPPQLKQRRLQNKSAITEASRSPADFLFSVLGQAVPQLGAAESSWFRRWNSNGIVTLLKQHIQQMFMFSTKRDKACLVKMDSLKKTEVLSFDKAEHSGGDFCCKSVRKVWECYSTL